MFRQIRAFARPYRPAAHSAPVSSRHMSSLSVISPYKYHAMWARPLLVALLFALAAFASANGAMGLGLEQWALTYWFAYVAVTVLFEAWMIGGWLKMRWGWALWISLLANLFTGTLCGAGGLCAPALHGQLVGSGVNPDPLLNAVALLSLYAVPSALVESIFWGRGVAKRSPRIVSDWRIVGRSILVHALGVPLALAVLLIPERPYIGLEAFTSFHRQFALSKLATVIRESGSSDQRLPRFSTPEEQAALLAQVPDVPDMWAALYTPDFRRFDRGEAKRKPWVWDTSLSGHTIGDQAPGFGHSDWRFILRAPVDDLLWRGIAVNLPDGDVKLVRKHQRLE